MDQERYRYRSISESPKESGLRREIYLHRSETISRDAAVNGDNIWSLILYPSAEQSTSHIYSCNKLGMLYTTHLSKAARMSAKGGLTLSAGDGILHQLQQL